MTNQKILLLGASLKPDRYSNIAVRQILKKGWELTAVGNKEGDIEGHPIIKNIPMIKYDTVTLYLSAKNQADYEETILALHPGRVIFNPGTENPKFEKELNENGIDVLRACTLVMISTGQF